MENLWLLGIESGKSFYSRGGETLWRHFLVDCVWFFSFLWVTGEGRIVQSLGLLQSPCSLLLHLPLCLSLLYVFLIFVYFFFIRFLLILVLCFCFFSFAVQSLSLLCVFFLDHFYRLFSDGSSRFVFLYFCRVHAYLIFIFTVLFLPRSELFLSDTQVTQHNASFSFSFLVHCTVVLSNCFCINYLALFFTNPFLLLFGPAYLSRLASYTRYIFFVLCGIHCFIFFSL